MNLVIKKVEKWRDFWGYGQYLEKKYYFKSINLNLSIGKYTQS